MTLFQQALDANNDGITAIIKGEKMVAIQAFANSLKLLKDTLSTSDDCLAPVASSRLDEIFTVDLTSELVASSAFESIIFSQAFKLPAVAYSEFISDFDLNVYSSAVLFNLALAHHAVGGNVFLKKAHKLYSMVLALLDGSALLSIRSALLVKLACINNVTQLLHTTGNQIEDSIAEQCLRAAEISTLVLGRLPIMETEIQSLLMNILLCCKPPSAAAAA